MYKSDFFRTEETPSIIYYKYFIRIIEYLLSKIFEYLDMGGFVVQAEIGNRILTVDVEVCSNLL